MIPECDAFVCELRNIPEIKRIQPGESGQKCRHKKVRIKDVETGLMVTVQIPGAMQNFMIPLDADTTLRDTVRDKIRQFSEGMKFEVA